MSLRFSAGAKRNPMIQKKLSSLVSTFEMNLQTYKERKEKNESEIRKNYIDPMFELMGWNVRNEGLREYEKEVKAEYSVKDEAGKKKADYCFSLNGTPMFFVEAKDPYINIEANRKAAFQIRSYCWNADVPVGVLTDFEEFAVYDGRYEPGINDSTDVARLKYFKYSDYKDKWKEITELFSKKAVASGSLSDWISTVKIKKGVLPVDEVFLKDMESWREMMAVNMASQNPALSRKEINFAVQRTIDRIVFLRICEDRGTEPYEEIKKLTDAGNIYSGLVKLFRAADKRYNSGIFCFEKEKGRTEGVDTLTPNLKIDDGILRTVIERLYYPSPYNFAVMPADILGHIYERFLGKVIQIDSDRVVSVEEKPEVRKAGGVYYTPTYIVDYIVKNTTEKLIEGKTPAQAEKMKFLDPACGSGSFLIQAYQHLLNWHLKWYVTDNAEKHLKGKKPVLVKDRNGNIRLSIETRKKILLNNIFGVDIDFQAVEVSKLSLLLKVLEGEDDFTMQQLGLFKERALPDLGKNIKCGNSLIGPDFYENVQMNLLDEEEIYRVNAFDWNAEFPEIMKKGGFDAVIGNPPYVRQETLGNAKPYFEKYFSVYQGTADLYVYFIEKAMALLCLDGFFGFIVSNKWMRANYGKPLRQWMKKKHISEIADFGDLPVFGKVSAYPCILVLKKVFPKKTFKAVQIKNLKFQDMTAYIQENHFDVEQTSLEDDGWSLGNQTMQNLLDKLRKTGVPLGEYVNGKIYYGIKTGLNEAFVIDKTTKNCLIAEDAKSDELIKPLLLGKEIKKYQPPSGSRYVIFIPKGWTNQKMGKEKDAWKWLKSRYPAIASHLNQFSEKAQKRCDKGDYWWELRACDYYQEFEKSKIIYPNICKKPEFAFDENSLYTNQKCFIISLSDKYLLGILNSAVTFFLFRQILPKLRGNFYEPSYIYFKDFPIRTIDFTNSEDKSHHDQMVSLVDQMIELHKKCNKSSLPQEKNVLQRQIETTDRQIDQLVYKLYDLTEEEIKIVESGS